MLGRHAVVPRTSFVNICFGAHGRSEDLVKEESL